MKYCQILLLLFYTTFVYAIDTVNTDSLTQDVESIIQSIQDAPTIQNEESIPENNITSSFTESVDYILQTNNTQAILALLNDEPELALHSLYDKNNLIHLSCLWGNLEVLKDVSAKNIKLTTLNTHKQSIWHMATQSKNYKCLIFLLEKAQTNKELLMLMNKIDNKGNNLINYHLLLQSENTDVLTALLMMSKLNLNELNKDGFGLVHIAKSLKKEKSIEILKKYGVDLSLKNKNNQSILDKNY